MPDICKQSKTANKYTAHCLRATAIQRMSDAGLETRQIMFMSGHRNEASVRSYSRDCSAQQKLSMSTILSDVARGHDQQVAQSLVPASQIPGSVAPAHTHSCGSVSSSSATISDVFNTGWITHKLYVLKLQFQFQYARVIHASARAN